MCALCAEWQLKRMTPTEVRTAVWEILRDELSDDELDHIEELLKKVREEET